MVMKSYGAKKVKASMSNRGVENVVKDEKLLSIYLNYDDVSQKMEGLDEIHDSIITLYPVMLKIC